MNFHYFFFLGATKLYRKTKRGKLLKTFDKKMERMPGEREFTYKYFYNGYWYHCRRGKTFDTYECANMRRSHCPGIVYEEDDGTIVVNRQHKCMPDLLALDKEKLLRQMEREAQETRNEFSSIFKSVCRTYVAIWF